ncbi:ethanolamine utilization [Fusarium sporotrichioides]|uniref:Ethanolamine utilization n=1 Tax=Fusarium sporotrichioides TaxID=5514 RepID=A0A395S5H8_FUSSP|nr:ethanolamine utilization [Fusarium sporotrichioides]
MSGNPVPLTVIKGAGFEHIPLPNGVNATTADFHTIRTKTDSPAHITSGFYKIEAGPARPAQYTFEESKYVLSGQVDVLDEATGITHHLTAGDFAFFHVGSKVQFSTKSQGFAFYVVTRPVRDAHPNLKGREEKTKSHFNKISHYEKLTPALDKTYGEGKVEWDIIGPLLKIASETKDVAESRERLRELGVTPTWEEFCYRELD